jgi:glycosyltransferase involved in cell wall biosynthesis
LKTASSYIYYDDNDVIDVIITINYNDLEGLKKTTQSVFSQTFKDIEYIVIDGGSVDGTVDIINKYKDRLFYTISAPDPGIFDAMNKGIQAATGEWILFLNAGDVFHEKLDLATIKFEWPNNTEFVVFPFVIEGDFQPILPDLAVRFGMPTSHQAMLISSKIAKQFKLNSKYKVAADYELFLKRKIQNNDCVYVEHIILSRVLPGGYSAENLNTMRREYQKIIFDHLGTFKALAYYFWSRPLFFKLIKAILPTPLFFKLKNSLRQL